MWSSRLAGYLVELHETETWTRCVFWRMAPAIRPWMMPRPFCRAFFLYVTEPAQREVARSLHERLAMLCWLGPICTSWPPTMETPHAGSSTVKLPDGISVGIQVTRNLLLWSGRLQVDVARCGWGGLPCEADMRFMEESNITLLHLVIDHGDATMYQLPGPHSVEARRKNKVNPHAKTKTVLVPGRMPNLGYMLAIKKSPVRTIWKRGHRLGVRSILDNWQRSTRWWFQIFFIFTPSWARFPFWLIFFKRVETTNQSTSISSTLGFFSSLWLHSWELAYPLLACLSQWFSFPVWRDMWSFPGG